MIRKKTKTKNVLIQQIPRKNKKNNKISNKNDQRKEKWCSDLKMLHHELLAWVTERQRRMSQSQAATLHLTRPHVPLVSTAPSAAEDNRGLSCEPPKSSAAWLTDNTARRAAAVK